MERVGTPICLSKLADCGRSVVEAKQRYGVQLSRRGE